MRTWCLIDFETLSLCELKSAGAVRYAQDVTTEVICLNWRTREGVPGCLIGVDRESFKELDSYSALMAMVLDPSVLFIAHNALFEKSIWRYIMVDQYGWPSIPEERWHDVMASCAEKGLPLKHEAVARALKINAQKDTAGSKLTISMSQPYTKNTKAGNARGEFKGYLPKLETHRARIAEYCQTDVDGEIEVHNIVGWQRSYERKVWLMDQEINQRGIMLDRRYIAQAKRVVADASHPLLKEFNQITKLEKVGQTAAIRDWCIGQGVDPESLPNLQKETIVKLIGVDVDAPDVAPSTLDDGYTSNILPLQTILPDHVKRALYVRSLLGSASVKKLPAMEACIGWDARARGLLQYHGAGPGRWAGRLLQPQNFPRGTVTFQAADGTSKAVPMEVVVDAIMSGDWEYVESLVGPAVETVASGLRHALIAAPGTEFVSGDFASIEARIVLALAGQHDKTALMASGADVYLDMAGAIFGREVFKYETPLRQIGKNTVLGCGFQMGAAKFLMKYCQGRTIAFAKSVIEAYRTVWAPLVPKLWYALQNAACKAVWDRTPQEAYGVRYELEGRWLTATLSSGSKLWYYNPQPVTRAMPWDKDDIRPAWTYQAWKNGHFITVTAYGGLLTENVVQRLARDLLVTAMFRCRAENIPIVLTVHDEILAEVDKQRQAQQMLKQIMEDRPQWAIDMQVPVLSECWSGQRYHK